MWLIRSAKGRACVRSTGVIQNVLVRAAGARPHKDSLQIRRFAHASPPPVGGRIGTITKRTRQGQENACASGAQRTGKPRAREPEQEGPQRAVRGAAWILAISACSLRRNRPVARIATRRSGRTGISI